MKQHQDMLEIRTRGRGLLEITDEVEAVVQESGVNLGLCTVFCRHTSASLFIQENADPTVQTDILNWLARLAPDGDARYIHDAEGPDDMAAHLRTMVTRSSEVIPVRDGRLTLGTWQGIYLAEHRTAPHRRQLIVHIIGE